MESDDDAQEMQLLQDQSADEYAPLMDLLSRRHVAAFKSLVRRALGKQPPAIDVNHRLGHPHNLSFLEKAARENLAEVVEFLLELGADPNRVNDELKRAPLHFAAEEGHAEALGALLRDPNIKPNLEAESFTALHYAVKADSLECVRLLLQAKASPNVPNSRGLTPIHLAAEKNSREIVQLIIDQAPVLDVDTYKNYRKETARMAINRRFPDIEVPDSTTARDYESQLRYFLTTNDQKAFEETFEEIQDPDALENVGELLRMSVKLDRREALGLLAKRGALEKADLLELARIAVEYAHPEILRKLLARRPDMANALLLPASQELGVPAKLGPNNRNNRLECLNLLLTQSNVNVRQVDDKGNTPLHYATRAECREAVDLLLRKGSYIGHMNAFGSPPLEHMPAAILEANMNECLQSANERTEEFEIIMDYQNLVPHDTSPADDEEYLTKRRGSARRGGRNPCSETEALLYIAENRNLKHLLKHPLLASFLYLKYLRIRHVLYINFLLYLVYFVLLNFYIWLITNDAAESSESSSKSNGTTLSNGDNGESEESMSLNNWRNHALPSLLLSVSLLYLLVRESLQFLSSPLHYITSLDNWLELGLIGLTIALLLGAGREIGALAILLSTWELVILMSQHPRMSTDIEMFKTVTVNFTKFLFLYIFLILAFAHAFYVLFTDDEKFQNPAGSLFKTIIMITGEFDSSDLAFGVYPLMSRLVFVGFIFLIVIILLNLLNGLAVNDTGEILAEAELVGLVARARLVAYAERIAVGSPFVPRLRLCCCLGPLPCGSLTTAPLRFMARRLQLFPRYLPHATLSVKPLKSYEITLHGRSKKAAGKCSRLLMDPRVAQRAKGILAERANESAEDRIQAQLADLRRKFDGFEALLRDVKTAVDNNNANNASEEI